MNHPFEEREGPVPTSVLQALGSLQTVPNPDQAFLTEGRRQFLAEAQELSRQAVTPASENRHKDWKALLSALLIPKRRDGPMLVMAKLMLVIALAFGGTIGTVNAAQDSLPGSALYPLKLQLEDWQMAQVQDQEMLAEQAMEKAQLRLEEAQGLSEHGESIPMEVATRYQAQLALAVQAMETLPEPAQSQTRTRLTTQLTEQLQEMQQLQQKLQDGSGGAECEALKTMLQAMEQTQLRLRDKVSNTDLDDENPETEQLQNQNGAMQGPQTDENKGDCICDGTGDCDGAMDQEKLQDQCQNQNGAEDNSCEVPGECNKGPEDTGAGNTYGDDTAPCNEAGTCQNTNQPDEMNDGYQEGEGEPSCQDPNHCGTSEIDDGEDNPKGDESPDNQSDHSDDRGTDEEKDKSDPHDDKGKRP